MAKWLVALWAIGLFMPPPLSILGFIIPIMRVGKPPKFVAVLVLEWIQCGIRQQLPNLKQVWLKLWCLFAVIILCCGVALAVRGPTRSPRFGSELSRHLFEDRWVWLAMMIVVLEKHAPTLFPGVSRVNSQRAVRLALLLIIAVLLWPLAWATWPR